MKQKLILFSALLIMFLLAGTASAIEDTENTDLVSVDTGLSVVSIDYSDDGPFKEGDIVEITVTFSEPVVNAELTVEYGDTEEPIITESASGTISDTVWCGSYLVPVGINDAVDVTVYGLSLDELDDVEVTDAYAFVVDNEAPRFKIIEPGFAVNKNCVLFNFNAFDKLDNTIAYAIFINDIEKKTGTVNSNGYVTYEPELAEGYYQWRIELEDDAGNICISEDFDLYVDTKCPNAILNSPEDCCVISTDPSLDPHLDPLDPLYDPLFEPDSLLTFNFTAQDACSAEYDLDLYYQVYINGEPDDEMCGEMLSGDCITIDIPADYFEDGAYTWSVEVEDVAGNCFTSEVREFYINCNGLVVSLNFPDGGFVSANPEFNFSVSGGAGLPFDYELLVNGTKVKEGTFVIGEDEVNCYSVNADVDEGINIPWTVCITDCADREYQPDPCYFSVDCTAPAAVKNLGVTDALSDTTWYYTYDEPGLYVCWDKNTEEDLYDGEDSYYGTPYVVFISDCEPSCIEDMELAVPVSEIYEPVSEIYDSDTYIPIYTAEYGGELVCCDEVVEPGKMFMYIGEYGGKPLVYGKDYWVAVIALDRAGNYDDCFAVCGPVKTYEDMTLTLDAGWNLKSVPKNPATFNEDACSVFGECSTVLYWDGSCWEFPETIEPCKGYWVYTPEASMSNVKFKPMSLDSTSPDVPVCLDLAPGWQMIGHTSTLPVDWAQTLGSLKGLLIDYKFSNLITYSHNEGWGGCTVSLGLIDLLSEEEPVETPYPVGILESDGLMVPGQGYWIFMKECGTYASVESVDFYPEGTVDPDEEDPVVPDEEDPVVPDEEDPVVPDEEDPVVPV
jgi:hypothetical protein